MIQIDEIGNKLCKAQAKIFEASLSETSCSSAVFLRRYMNSDFAGRMDEGSYLFESNSEKSAIDEIEQQFGKSEYGKIRYSENELYWMGYLYRYWCYTYKKSSKQVYKIIKPAELRELFFSYHTLDTAAAIERILEAKNRREEDMTKRGVEILRKIINSNPEYSF